MSETRANLAADEQTDLPEGDNPQDVISGVVEARDRYRGERDAAREALAAAGKRIARYQRAEIERLASERLAHPSDVLTLSGNDIADYLDDDGNVDPDKVAADIEAILSERPGLAKPLRAVDPSQGRGGATPPPAPTWSSLLR
ncbi:hypothetical protein KL953_04115 [Mycolicibacterium goodii]|uniref:hypothetical protein n=1 Tax=Mycolicibacterium goodii TaxID=134601 RepID=UPI001BDC772D|nr:hypothetical protein [Mycolicibacterium goodii]MBU8808069.1 hypothetical protein [Mycolicibacterium goodii]